MAEYIGCRICDSKKCDGCNINTLEKMLYAGKFDCLMDEHRSINQFAEIEPVKHGRWINHLADAWGAFNCSICGESTDDTCMGKPIANYCPNCGAKMEG